MPGAVDKSNWWARGASEGGTTGAGTVSKSDLINIEPEKSAATLPAWADAADTPGENKNRGLRRALPAEETIGLRCPLRGDACPGSALYAPSTVTME